MKLLARAASEAGAAPPGMAALAGCAAGRPVSVQLRDIVSRLGRKDVRLEELMATFKGRNTNVLVILLVLPLMLPVTVPFISTPLGILIALTGLRMAQGRRPWVPSRFARKRFPAGFLPRLLGHAGRITGWLERMTRPRWVSSENVPGFHRVIGLMIASGGLLLLLPLPLPLINLVPASAVLLLATASLRHDGLCFLGGCVVLALSFCLFGSIFLGGMEAVILFWG